MADKILSDLKSASLSGITDDQGNSLISPNTDGEQAYIFGDTAMREIQAGVANGDFAVPPPDATGTISADNELPYWTFTDSSAGEISAALVADPSTASGNLLTWSIDGGATTGNSATLRRYVRVAGNANRNTAYQGEIFAITGTGATSDRQRVRATLSIESVDADYLPLTASSSRFDVANNLNDKSLSTGWITPDAEAAFLLITITINIPTLSPAALVTLPITEVRLNSGTSIVAFPNATDPTNSTWIISAANETGGSDSQLLISNYDDLTGTYPSMSLIKGASNASIEINANDGGTIELTTGVGGLLKHTGDEVTFDNSSPLSGGVFTVNMDGSSGGVGTIDLIGTTEVDGTLSTTGNVNVNGTIGVKGNINIGISDTSTAGDITFKGGNGGSIRAFSAAAGNDSLGIYNTSGSDFTNLVAESFFPGGQGSFRLTHDGNFDFNDTVDVTGSITATSSIIATAFQSTSSLTALNASGGGDITLTGADTSVPISGNGELLAIANTTTATTNSARWVLTSGSTYALRRDSSTRRVKTNIVEADSAVLVAAKNLRAFHYEALEKDSEGNLVPSGKHTLGLIAEEIADAGLGCAVTYDGEGLPDGYDERVIIAALLHRINDLEARLAALEGA
jgi:hypothetical protein